jgi:hypothetical protein
MQKFDNNIGFWEKRQIFRWKLSKIAENCDHNIDPSFVPTSDITTENSPPKRLPFLSAKYAYSAKRIWRYSSTNKDS